MARETTIRQSKPPTDGGEHDWEAHDAMHTLLRAREISGNEKLLKRVRKHAARHAKEMKVKSQHAASLARTGHISEKAMAKLAKNHSIA